MNGRAVMRLLAMESAVAALTVMHVIDCPYTFEGKGPGLVLEVVLAGHWGIECTNQKPEVASVISMPLPCA